jgi:hypothetical protein|tara:strand:+ start:2588 stop:3298 length:711 start_codon:yes stop_codon:yes gene_type:complete
MIISIHQPNYIPWIGYFHKIAHSNVFVIFDDIQFPRGKDFIFRNKIKTENGSKWLSVPTKNKSKLVDIKNIEINNDVEWSKKHINSIYSNYNKSQFFEQYFKKLEFILNKKWELLIDLNLEINKTILELLKINTRIVRSSELNIKDIGTTKIIKIIQKLEGNVYLTGWGPGSRRYIEGNEKEFSEAGIDIKFQKIMIPEYKQNFGNFIPNLSILDILFNVELEKIREIINSQKVLQ